MSTKNLSRTVIEGGRAYRNKYDRRTSHGTTRALTREWLDQVRLEATDADDSEPGRGPKVYKGFRDKLGPPKRWLGAQVGRPWSNVYGELHARFDTRTTAGRHIVYDHMLPWVIGRRDSPMNDRWQPFFVDGRGILRRRVLWGRAWRRACDEVIAWSQHRIAMNTFTGWWWYRREPLGNPCVRRWECKQSKHFYFELASYHAVRYVPLIRLTAAEIRTLERLDPELRALVVIDAEPLQRREQRRRAE